jgi:hypothetical protein
VQAGPLSRETFSSGVPTPSLQAEGNICGSAMRELSWDPARSENLGMYGSSLRENREIPSLPVAVIGWRAVWATLRRYSQDERGWEVRRSRSTCEAAEQCR